MANNLVEIEGMKRYYEMVSGTVKALDGVDIEVKEGERSLRRASEIRAEAGGFPEESAAEDGPAVFGKRAADREPGPGAPQSPRRGGKSA